ncbi:MAG: hypothetical protein CMP47_11980 [Rickettsiales bacterium]|mgnify:FL=1|nr:hypothetical protein [Rickettsiales bacterium]|tara:strand:- start:1281 stop:2225 length:945 start_codon:yes stop_codon:yes gene_type:complete
MRRTAEGDPGSRSDIELSLAIAVQGAQANLSDILKTLPQTPGVELLICYASDDPLPGDLAPILTARADLRSVVGTPAALIPELWRDGFVAARGGWVATLTAHCPPGPDWLPRALELVKSATAGTHAAFGGAIVAGQGADRVTRAIQLLRYTDAGPGGARRQVHDLSADNALYLRAAVMNCEDLLPAGFWEPNYHRRFLKRGLVMEMIPDLVVVHRNRYSAADFRRQRRRHGRVFGRQRSETRPRWARWAMLLASPAAFPVFALKQTWKILSRPALRSELPRVAGLFYGFMASWCWGEIRGYADALHLRPEGHRS